MKDFTAQQKEIVARKLGYDGPMQGFDEFIASSPALGAKYASITGKFAERMAKGGLVKMKPKGYAYGGPVYTDEELYQQAGTWEGAAALRDEQNRAIASANAAAGIEAQRLRLLKNKEEADALVAKASQATVGKTNDTTTSVDGGLSFTSNNVGAGSNTTQVESDATRFTRLLNQAATDKAATVASLTPGMANDMLYRSMAGSGGVPTAEFDKYGGYNAVLALAEKSGMQMTPDWIAKYEVANNLPKSEYTIRNAAVPAATTTTTNTTSTGGVTGGGPVTFAPVGGTPQAAAASQIKPEKIVFDTKQDIDTKARAGKVETITGTTPADTVLADEIDKTKAAETMTASTSADTLKTALDKISPTSGTLSEAAKVTAEEDATTTLAGSAAKAEQISTAQKVGDVTERTISEAEKVSGTAVDKAKIDTAMALNVAATGTVESDMTVQGQLAKLTSNFDATNPPPWAAGALRAVTAEMAARGLGASSLAGAALVQAAMEKALPIASADAAIYQQFASQNLSNKQQIAVLTAQQRATFLGQEFDQSFQTRVVNAARVSEIANLNFNAKQQVALENAKLAQSVDLANLNSRQAAFMAELAQTATLETANLNNRQQAAVVNAQSALQMDLTNLSYEQQTTVLKTQLTAQTILSDTAAENAAKQFNASSKNQTTQFFASLSSQVSQFNSAQSNSMEQFKVDQANSVKKFNAEVTNQREQFNAQQRLVIDQSNAQWQREIATINTGAINTINLSNAQLAQQMTVTEYNNEIQMYRDAVSHAWTSAEKDADRATTLAGEEIRAAAAIAGANIKADGDSSSALGAFIGRVLVGVATGGAVK